MRAWGCLLFVMLASSTAAWGQKIPSHPSELRFAELKIEVPEAAAYSYRLSNGVQVFVAEDRSLPLVDVAVAVRAGEYLDPRGRVGVASLTAAMLRRGGAGSRDARAFDEAVDALGARLRAVAGGTRAGATLNCLSGVLPQGLDLLFDMLREPRFEAQPFRVARENLQAAMRARGDDPLAVMEREWSWLLFGRDHFSSRRLRPGDLDALTLGDLRAFHGRYWQPANFIVAVSGDVETAAILAELERRFAEWPAGEAAPWPTPAPRHQPAAGLYHVEMETPQVKISLGHRGAHLPDWQDADRFALAVAGKILENRVAGRIRTQEGLAYRTGVQIDVGQHWAGGFQIFLETQPESAAPAIRMAVDEIQRLIREPVAEPELRFTRRTLVDAFPLLFDSAEEIAGYFAEDAYLGRPHAFWQTYAARMEGVTSRQVQAAVRRHLSRDRLLVLLVGPWEGVARGDAARRSGLASVVQGPLVRLPRRDPLTLKDLP